MEDIEDVHDHAESNSSLDVELKNVLLIENVLRSLHRPDSMSLESKLEKVLQLENVLKKVKGNVGDFSSMMQSLMTLHNTTYELDVGNDFAAAPEEQVAWTGELPQPVVDSSMWSGQTDSQHVEMQGDQQDQTSSFFMDPEDLSELERALEWGPPIPGDDMNSFNSIDQWAATKVADQSNTLSENNTLPRKPAESTSWPFKDKSEEEEVTSAAKMLFAKKSRNMFYWLHPGDTQTALRRKLDSAWDELSPKETEFFISQVLGPYNKRQVKPMVNPRIYELLNLPTSAQPFTRAVDTAFTRRTIPREQGHVSKPRPVSKSTSRKSKKTSRRKPRRLESDSDSEDVDDVEVEVEVEVQNGLLKKEYEDFCKQLAREHEECMRILNSDDDFDM